MKVKHHLTVQSPGNKQVSAPTLTIGNISALTSPLARGFVLVPQSRYRVRSETLVPLPRISDPCPQTRVHPRSLLTFYLSSEATISASTVANAPACSLTVWITHKHDLFFVYYLCWNGLETFRFILMGKSA